MKIQRRKQARMYVNIMTELARQRLTRKDLAGKSGIDYQTLCNKLKKADGEGFTLKQADEIRSALGVEMSLDELFEWVD
jgi:DNA-binding Xre family transcriptional regulator